MSFLINLDSTGVNLINESSHDYTVNFNPPIQLIGKWEMALIKANLWYSWYNISSENNNNNLRYFNGLVYRDTIIPDGQYTISQLNNYLHQVMDGFGDYTIGGSGQKIYDIEMVANLSTIRVNLTLTNSYTLDLSTDDLYLLLGFDSAIITTSGDAPYVANINNNINTIEIHNSLVRGSYSNNNRSDTLYTFVPSSVPGTNIDIDPVSKIYIPIDSNLDSISSIRSYLLDNTGRPVNLNGEPATYLLHFRAIDTDTRMRR